MIQYNSNGDRQKAFDLACDIFDTETDKVLLFNGGKLDSVFFIMPYQIYKLYSDDPMTECFVSDFMRKSTIKLVGRREFVFSTPLHDPLLNRTSFRVKVLPKPKPKKTKVPKEPKKPNKKETPNKPNG